jgi:hypothetical protein
LNSVRYCGKYIARVSADQADRADHYGEYYGKHHSVLGNVLTFLAGPKGTWVSQHRTVSPALLRPHNSVRDTQADSRIA